MKNTSEYKNKLNLVKDDVHGNERRREILSNIFQNSTPLPKAITYEEIDKYFKKWVETELSIACEGRELPTMSLFSNQKFSEYSQTWSYSDENKNLLMNFKTVSRDNNPQDGNNQGGLWNIPGDRYYLMFRESVLDNNGTESFLDYKVKQPFCIDLLYKVSIFTNKFQTINEFNNKVNDKFKARQCYLNVNGHYIPMILDSITDDSEYSINDRQFFSQTYIIKVMAYIINEDDFKVEEIPSRFVINFTDSDDKKSIAEIEEGNIASSTGQWGDKYYFKPILLKLTYPLCNDICKFTIDTDFNIDNIEYENIFKNKLRIFINDDEYFGEQINFKKNDAIKIIIKRLYKEKESIMLIYGHDPNIVYSYDNNLPEIEKDFVQYEDEYDIKANE